MPPSRLSSGKQFSRFLRKRLAVVNSIRDDAQRQRSDTGSRLCLGLAIRENAGKSRNLGNPSPIVRAQAVAGAAVLAPLQYSAIVWAAIMGWLVWRDAPTLPIIVGNAIIIGSGLYVAARGKMIGDAVE